MKLKSHQLLVLFITSTFTIHTQPTLTATGINPVVGDVYTLNRCNYLNPGTQGANQTWNLSGLNTIYTTNYTTATPSSTIYSGLFPNSNFCMIDPVNLEYIYNKTSTIDWQNQGAYYSSILLTYSNAEDYLHYPFNMGDTYTDPWVSKYVSSGILYTRTGTTSVTYDGYGTLILPNGTFNNVARVHSFQNYQEVYAVNNTTFTTIYTNDQYAWYSNGIHQSLASVSTLLDTTHNVIIQQNGLYTNTIATFQNEYDNISSSITSFPNPASEEINFIISHNINLKEIQIYDIVGKLIYYEKTSDRKLNLKLNNLNNGTYLAKFISFDGKIGVKKIVVDK